MNKKTKGEWGYISCQRKRVLLITLVLYVCAIGIYLFGYLHLNTTKNLFTVIAVLGILPASKSLVNLIMFLRFKSLSKGDHEYYSNAAGDVCVRYEMPFTTYEKTYFTEAAACRNKTVICFCPQAGKVFSNVRGGSLKSGNVAEVRSLDISRLSEHLKVTLSNDGYKDITVKVYDNREAFVSRLRELAALKESDIRTDASIMNTLLSVTL